jgi:hypothetical protein
MTPTVRHAALALLAIVVAAPFFVATTFLGDDYLFLAFARHAPNPLAPFVSDHHGGEYYRPLPMAIWWLLGRPDLGSAPFAALALALHAGVAAMAVLLLRRLQRPTAVAFGAGALVLIAPQNLEAAYWFSASTDLLATAFVLASLLALASDRKLASAAAALAAYLSKESAYVLPLLAVLVLPSLPWWRRLLAAAPHAAVLALVLVARTLVLGGRGGAGDPRTGIAGVGLQVASGFSHLFTGNAALPEVLAFGVGAAIVALTILAVARQRRLRLGCRRGHCRHRGRRSADDPGADPRCGRPTRGEAPRRRRLVRQACRRRPAGRDRWVGRRTPRVSHRRRHQGPGPGRQAAPRPRTRRPRHSGPK